MAHLILMMESLHMNGLIHRDIKPSNILLTKAGFLKLSDFGTCFAPQSFFQPEIHQQIKSVKNIAQSKKTQKLKKGSEQQDESTTATSQRRYTFVGTACYMAPQLLNEDKCGPQSDLWALGCIFYELIHKKSPFYDQSEGMVWTKILNNQIKIYNQTDKNTEISQAQRKMQDLIKSLLIKENQKRLGYGTNGYQNLKNHQFFKGIDWNSQGETPIEQLTIFVDNYLSQKQSQLKSNQTAILEKQSQKEKVLYSGVVGKKMYFGNYKQRTLVLHSTPKLVYYDTDSGQKKGEIVLSKSTPVKGDKKCFEISNEKKTYYFKTKQSQQWVDMIKLAILNAFY